MSHGVSVQSLQGLVARTQPSIFRLCSDNSLLWLNQTATYYGLPVNSTFETNVVELLMYFRSSIKGYITCNIGDGSVNVATSASALYQSVVIPSDSTSIAQAAGLPLVLDVRGMTESQGWSKYFGGGAVSSSIVVHQDPAKYASLFLSLSLSGLRCIFPVRAAFNTI